MKNGISKAQVRAFGIMIALAMALSIPTGNAALGGQTFPNVNWDDNDVTTEEIEIAQSTFSEPGILPSSPLYFLKRFAEDVRLALTFDKEARAKLYLERAKTRLAETQKLVEENKPAAAAKTADDFAGEFSNVNASINATGIGRDVSAIAKESSDVAAKSVIVLELVSQKVPETARPAIENAINTSIEKKVEIENAGKISAPGTQGPLTEKIREEKKKVKEIRESIKEIKKGKREICIQVITPARNPGTGEIKEFPTPCDVPEGWQKLTLLSDPSSEYRDPSLKYPNTEVPRSDKDPDNTDPATGEGVCNSCSYDNGSGPSVTGSVLGKP